MRGLYAITDSQLIPPGQIAGQVAAAIAGGAAAIQYRDKQRSAAERLQEVTALVQLCNQHGIPLIINDDVELAHAIGASGVHLGQTDTSIACARERLGADATIGISCYNRLELAREAEAAGADYIAFGRFFPSHSKPDAVTADVALLETARAQLRLPIVAIGGITPANGRRLLETGADQLAVIHGVFGQADVKSAAQSYTVLFGDRDGP